VIRDLLGMLKDQNSLVRLAAVDFLSKLRAKIAIPYIQDVLRITGDDKHREMIQRYLRELEQG
jgi:vesicle coat complex subunit